jgi:lysophospholipase L1-like esterase
MMCDRAALLCLLIAVSSGLSAADVHDGSLADTNLRFIGRWDRSSATVAHSYWSTAYVRTAFTGTTAHVRLAEGLLLESYIDGHRSPTAPWPGGVDLTPVPVATGTHTLMLVAGGQNQEMAFQGLVLDPGASTQSVASRPLIEFVGDSITANGGRIDRSKVSPDGPATSNYSGLTADALACDRVQVAFSGVALATGYGFFGDRTGFDAWYFRLKNCNHPADNAPWAFAYDPVMVVVNLGTNDMKDGKRPDEAAFAVTYATFLRAIRARLPHAVLVGMRPFGGFEAAGIARAVATLQAAGDQAVHAVDTSGWLEEADFSDGIHPTVSGHAKAALRLTDALRPLLAAALATQGSAR